MAITPESLREDIERIQRISIVPSMLEVICRSTGMGFAAIARVTDEKWIACSVRDEINFGLKPGGELILETTICNEIRQSRQAVIIDHVAADEQFCGHHTPKMYGFQSYISMPIILNSGEFFGTLCAIDPKPAVVSDLKITGMFNLFTQLIAFHLQAMDMLERSHEGFMAVNEQLQAVEEQNRRYEHLTYHSLREPVRKISLFSDLLVQEAHGDNLEKVRNTASQIKRFSLDLAGMLRQLNDNKQK
jgi:GAF domain-containing protein